MFFFFCFVLLLPCSFIINTACVSLHYYAARYLMKFLNELLTNYGYFSPPHCSLCKTIQYLDVQMIIYFTVLSNILLTQWST